MKRVFVILAAAFVGVAFGNAQMHFSVGAQAGSSFSSFPSPESDFFGMGYGGGVHGDLTIMKYFAARLNFDYFMFTSKKDKIASTFANTLNAQGQTDPQGNPFTASDFGISGFNGNIFGINADAIGKLPLVGSPFEPYALVGFGLGIISISSPTITFQGRDITQQANIQTNSTTKFSMNFGGGAEYHLRVVSLFLEVRYVLIFTSDNSTGHVPVVVGVSIPM